MLIGRIRFTESPTTAPGQGIERKQMAKKTTKNRAASGSTKHPYKIGESYLLRTVTHYIAGKLAAVYPLELVFDDAAWVADTGRFNEALKSGSFNEQEPYQNSVIVGRGCIVDMTAIKLTYPLGVK